MKVVVAGALALLAARLRLARQRRRFERCDLRPDEWVRRPVLRERAERPGCPARHDRAPLRGRHHEDRPARRGGDPSIGDRPRRERAGQRGRARRRGLRPPVQRAAPRSPLRDSGELCPGRRGDLRLPAGDSSTRGELIRRHRRPGHPHHRGRLARRWWRPLGSSRPRARPRDDPRHHRPRRAPSAWFEEGFATVIQREDALAADTDALVARSLRANGVVTLEQLATLPDWHRTFARVGRPQYAFAALAVARWRRGWGRGASSGRWSPSGAVRASRTRTRRSGTGRLEAFVASFDAVTEDGAEIAVSETSNASGDREWTLYAFPPNSVVRVRISGVSNGYDLAFMVTADDQGMFRGSLGRPRRSGPTRSLRRAARCTQAPRSRTRASGSGPFPRGRGCARRARPACGR